MTHYEGTNQSIKIDLELRDKLELAEKKIKSYHNSVRMFSK